MAVLNGSSALVDANNSIGAVLDLSSGMVIVLDINNNIIKIVGNSTLLPKPGHPIKDWLSGLKHGLKNLLDVTASTVVDTVAPVLKGDPLGLLKKLPIVGPIVDALSNALSSVSGGTNKSLTQLVGGADDIVKVLMGFITVTVNIGCLLSNTINKYI